MRNALVVILATVSATVVCAQEVRHVETQATVPPGPGVNYIRMIMACPPGFVPDGIRTLNLYGRFTSLPEREVAELFLLNPAEQGDQNLTTEIVRLTCVKN